MSRGESGPGDEEETSVAEKEVLEVAVHAAERTLDADLRSIDRHHSELDRSIRLGAASLGALLVIAGLFVTVRFVPDTLAGTLLIAGTVFNLAAMIVWITTLTGIPRPADTGFGPDLHDLSAACRDPDWDVQGLQVSLLDEYAKNADDNLQFLRVLANGRRIGLLLLIGAVFLYWSGIGLILLDTLFG